MWKRSILLSGFMVSIGFPGLSLAASQSIILDVPGMNCAACPVTVKKALSKIDGVATVEPKLGRKEVAVTFDDSKTTVKALTQATANAGYPSSPKRSQ